MDRAVRRSARSQSGPNRLGRTHSVCRDAQLRPARVGEPPSLPRALRQRAPAGTDQSVGRSHYSLRVILWLWHRMTHVAGIQARSRLVIKYIAIVEIPETEPRELR